MKKCRSCQENIDDKAKKCPHCQEKQGNWAQRHPFLTGIIGIIFFFIIISSIGGGDEGTVSNQSDTTNPEIEIVETEESPTITEVEEEVSSETMSQQNAIKKAESYLNYSGFSRKGLISQLEFEKFSTEDAIYAVDNIDVDWNEQAVKKAKSYLDNSAFSREGLINQLEFEGFTTQQATYGVDAVGL